MPNTPLALDTMQNTSHTHLHNPHTYPFHESRSREMEFSSTEVIHPPWNSMPSVNSIKESFCEFYELKRDIRLTFAITRRRKYKIEIMLRR